MKVFSIVFLRFMALIKWHLQSLGIISSLYILSPNRDAEIIAFCLAALIVIPEIFMGSLLWMFKGAYSVYEEKDQNPSKKIIVLGRGALLFSSYHYIASISSLGVLAGFFLGAPILFGGITFFACILLKNKIEIFNNYYFQI